MSAPPKGKSVLQCGRPQQLARRSGVDISRVDEGRTANGKSPGNRDANLAGWADNHRGFARKIRLQHPPRIAPRELACVDQFQVDRSTAKNSNDDGFLQSFYDAVTMRRVREPPEKAAGRYRTIALD